MANKRITDVDFIELLNGDESFFVNQNNAIKQINRKDIIVGISNGGTGSSTVAGARNALGLGNTDGALPIANGGTGANSAKKARLNLGIGATLYVNAPAGINVTISKDKTSYSKVADSNGLAIFESLDIGTWTIRIADGDKVATQTFNVEPDYSATIAFFAATISITYPSGSTCTCSDGKTTLKASNTTGSWKCIVPNTGTWTVKITDGSRNASTNVSITANGQSKSVTLSYFAATISITYPSGSTCTCSDGKTTLKAPNTTGTWSCTVPNSGTWTVSCSNGSETDSKSVAISNSGQSETVTLSYNAIPAFTYSGDYKIVNDADTAITTSKDNWKIRFLTSGTLKFTNLSGASKGIDVFLVGGGASGKTGAGGGGGYTKTKKGVSVNTSTTYNIVVGAGGTNDNGGSTSAFNLTANGGSVGSVTSGGSGGSGGGGGGAYNNGPVNAGDGGSDGENGKKGEYNGGTGQGSTTREFGESTGTLYAGGGGGGGSGNLSKGGAGGSGGGGAGAACGSSSTENAGKNGTTNTGGGGGAGGSIFGNTGYHPDGKGGSGIVIIRNARG